MKIDHQDFIGTYTGVFEEGFCSHLISEFERNVGQGAGSDRLQSEGSPKHMKDDHQLFFNGKNLDFEPFNGGRVIDLFFDGLQRCYQSYADQYSVIQDGRISTSSMKMQRTSPGGGYHVWHCEQGNGDHASRALVYMLYLNTLTDAQCGETEFLYQERRIQPVENTMLLWPAAFTHAHRGNPVYRDGTKYIVTGWFKYE